jgi:hypothetical protein
MAGDEPTDRTSKSLTAGELHELADRLCEHAQAIVNAARADGMNDLLKAAHTLKAMAEQHRAMCHEIARLARYAPTRPSARACWTSSALTGDADMPRASRGVADHHQREPDPRRRRARDQHRRRWPGIGASFELLLAAAVTVELPPR